jgi:hypothetical protein
MNTRKVKQSLSKVKQDITELGKSPLKGIDKLKFRSTIDKMDKDQLENEYNDYVDTFVNNLDDLKGIIVSNFKGKVMLDDDINKVFQYIQNNLKYYVEDPILKKKLGNVLKKIDKNGIFVKEGSSESLWDKIKDQFGNTNTNITEYHKKEKLPINAKCISRGTTCYDSEKDKLKDLNDFVKEKKDDMLEYAVFLEKEIMLNNLFLQFKNRKNEYNGTKDDLIEKIKQLNEVKPKLINDKKKEELIKSIQTYWDNIYKEMIEYLYKIDNATSLEELSKIQDEIENKDSPSVVNFCIKGKQELNWLYDVKKTTEDKIVKEYLKKSSPKRDKEVCGDKLTPLTLKRFLQNNLDFTSDQKLIQRLFDTMPGDVLDKLTANDYRVIDEKQIVSKVKKLLGEMSDKDKKELVSNRNYRNQKVDVIFDEIKKSDSVEKIDETYIQVYLNEYIKPQFGLTKNTNDINAVIKNNLLKNLSDEQTFENIKKVLSNKLNTPNLSFSKKKPKFNNEKLVETQQSLLCGKHALNNLFKSVLGQCYLTIDDNNQPWIKDQLNLSYICSNIEKVNEFIEEKYPDDESMQNYKNLFILDNLNINEECQVKDGNHSYKFLNVILFYLNTKDYIGIFDPLGVYIGKNIKIKDDIFNKEDKQDIIGGLILVSNHWISFKYDNKCKNSIVIFDSQDKDKVSKCYNLNEFNKKYKDVKTYNFIYKNQD